MQNSHKIVRCAFSLLVAGTLIGCLDVGGVPDRPTNPATERFASSLGIDSGLAGFNKTANGVYYKDTQVGTGPQLDSITVVVMSFQAYLTDGSLVDFHPNGSIDMNLIKVAGLIEGMLGYGATGGMRPGGTRIIVVPSELAYANQPQGSIPANSTLVFFVTIQNIG